MALSTEEKAKIIKKFAKNDKDINLVTFDEMLNAKEEKSKRLFFFGKNK